MKFSTSIKGSYFHEENGCSFLLPVSRRERRPMTKPKEKTRKELQAEIENGKKMTSEPVREISEKTSRECPACA